MVAGGRNRNGSTSNNGTGSTSNKTDQTSNANAKWKCGCCNGTVQSGVQCDEYSCWFHGTCVNISDPQLQLLQTLTTTCWYCTNCYTRRQDRSVILCLSDSVGLLIKKLDILETAINTVDAKTVDPQVSTASATRQNAPCDDSHKYRVKIIGIKESDKRFNDARQLDDKQAIEKILDTLKLPEAKLKDCYHVGKFSKDRSRPVIAFF